MNSHLLKFPNPNPNPTPNPTPDLTQGGIHRGAIYRGKFGHVVIHRGVIYREEFDGADFTGGEIDQGGIFRTPFKVEA